MHVLHCKYSTFTLHADWTAGTEDKIKIGYDYAQSVTGVTDDFDLDLDKIAEETDAQVVPDPLDERRIFAMSSDV